MEWKFFFGAVLLAAALVVPHAGLMPVIAGLVLARGIQLVWAQWGDRD